MVLKLYRETENRRVKKIINICLTFALCIVFFAVQVVGEDTPNNKLKSAIEALKANNILAFYSADYDKDGSEEAFVLIGDSEEGMGGLNYFAELWFISEKECYRLEDTKPYSINNMIMRFGNSELLILTEEYASHELVNIWGVQDGKPYKDAISGRGGDFEYSDQNEIALTDSEYDAGEDRGMKLGHTYKKYYFYWDEEEACFREYGGVRITEEQLLHCDGAKDILDEIKEQGNQIDDIFYRDNKIIHINYSSGDSESRSFDNATLRLKENEVYLLTMAGVGDSLLDASNQFGIFSAAMIPEIAVYPDTLPEVFSNYKHDERVIFTEKDEPSVHLPVFIVGICLLLIILPLLLLTVIKFLHKHDMDKKL